jgi:hypothetical protein
MRLRKTLNSILVLALMAAVLALAAGLIRESGKRVVVPGGTNSGLAPTGAALTYDFAGGSVIGRLGALAVGADTGVSDGLRGHIDGELTNRLSHALKIRNVEAFSRATGDVLRQFRFRFEKTAVAPGQRFAFAGAVPVPPDFFNRAVRRYDLVLRVVTDIGAFELPLETYTLDVEPAIAAGLLTGNQVRLGEAEGMIHFLHCEQVSAHEVCEPMLRQMGAQ